LGTAIAVKGGLHLSNMGKAFDLQTGKETWKQLENIHRFGYSYSTIFIDFIDVCLFSLLSFTENMQYPDVIERLKNNKLTGKYEEQYMKIVEQYKENQIREKGNRPADYFAQAWGSLLKETSQSEEDVLGEIFMAKISFGEHGQFFTPFHITDMMTKLLYSKDGKQKNTVCDPACGSGRFFISFGKLNKEAYFYGVDLSPICAKMTALNMWLFDLNADIYHGDSLAMNYFHIWKIRKGGFVYESEIDENKSSLPEPIKKALKTQAEQQRLF
jgi:type I restriction-modification system DNA methylase subunit